MRTPQDQSDPRKDVQAAACSGPAPQIDADACIGCGRCAEACPFDAISLDGPPNWLVAKTYHIDQFFCKVCGACIDVCPLRGIHAP